MFVCSFVCASDTIRVAWRACVRVCVSWGNWFVAGKFPEMIESRAAAAASIMHGSAAAVVAALHGGRIVRRGRARTRAHGM